MKKSLFALTAAVAVSGLSVGTASAASNSSSINISVNTVVRADEGATRVLQTKTVSSEKKGEACTVVAKAKNQGSVHPGNNLVVRSGNSQIVLRNVERAAGATTESSSKITLGDQITVSLVMGRDKVFSGGMDVALDCEKPEPVKSVAPAQPEAEQPEAEQPAQEQPKEESKGGEDVTVTTLPETGPGALLAAAAGATGLALSGAQLRASKRRLRDAMRQR